MVHTPSPSSLPPALARKSLFSPRSHRVPLSSGVREYVRGIKRQLSLEGREEKGGSLAKYPWHGGGREAAGQEHMEAAGQEPREAAGQEPREAAGQEPMRAGGRVEAGRREELGDRATQSHSCDPVVSSRPPGATLPVTEVPQAARTVFSQTFQQFNSVQSAVLPSLLHSDHTVVVTAPTGAGKTVLFELAIVRMLSQAAAGSQPRAVYLAPVKALCAERSRDWTEKFKALGLKVLLMTGDSTRDDMAEIRTHQLIIATPEKWDAISRRSCNKRDAISSVKLVMVDEVHLLSDRTRGHVLEAVLCRMKMLQCPARYIAVSATFPNIEDVANWLGGANARVFKVRVMQ